MGLLAGLRARGWRVKEPGRRVAPPERIAGADILASRPGKCGKCDGDLLLGQTRDSDGTIRWHNFDRKGESRGGLLVFSRHYCRL